MYLIKPVQGRFLSQVNSQEFILISKKKEDKFNTKWQVFPTFLFLYIYIPLTQGIQLRMRRQTTVRNLYCQFSYIIPATVNLFLPMSNDKLSNQKTIFKNIQEFSKRQYSRIFKNTVQTNIQGRRRYQTIAYIKNQVKCPALLVNLRNT